MNMSCITLIIVKHCFDSRGSYETYHNFWEWECLCLFTRPMSGPFQRLYLSKICTQSQIKTHIDLFHTLSHWDNERSVNVRLELCGWK